MTEAPATTTRGTRKEWETLRAHYERAYKQWSKVHAEYSHKYRWSSAWWIHLNRTEQTRYERAEQRETEASDRMYAWLDAHSPRYGWRSMVPCSYIHHTLTFEDATTTGPLSEVPPVPYAGTRLGVTAWALAPAGEAKVR